MTSTSRRRLSGALAALTCLASAGCYKVTFIDPSATAAGEEKEKWSSFFLWGLVGEEQIDARDFCPNGNIARVQTGGNFLTGLVGFITLGIYAPRRVLITCASGSAFRIDLDRDGVPVRVLDGDRLLRPEPIAGKRGHYRVAMAEVRP